MCAKGINDQSSIVAQQVKNSTSLHEVVDLIPGLIQWFKDLALPPMVLSQRCSSDPVLLWLWRKPVAAASI